MALVSYTFGFGLNQAQRSALALGVMHPEWLRHVRGNHRLSQHRPKIAGDDSVGGPGPASRLGRALEVLRFPGRQDDCSRFDMNYRLKEE